MTVETAANGWTPERMASRVVRYAELEPCFNAFVDTRTPGSERKENFCIIGPGVSENPNQRVHIAEAHGFNIGGARQPPGCVNSQHSHETAEVFVVHSGRWRFDFGEHGDDAQVFAGPGDVISLPVRAFRGFTNVGKASGFLWSVLGGDDPGRVTWAPQVFELAQQYGLVLLESGRLVDTVAGEEAPAGSKTMAPPSHEDIEALSRIGADQAERCVWRAPAEPAPGETPVIGPGAPLAGGHGFTMTRLHLAPADTPHAGEGAEVIFVQDGALDLRWAGGGLRLEPGDTFTAPSGLAFTCAAQTPATAFVVRAGETMELASAA